MLDEFDDPDAATVPRTLAGPRRSGPERERWTAAALVSRVYRSASDRWRAEMLTRLLRSLGPLSLVAVASGAFARLLQRGALPPEQVAIEDAALFSADQIRELALFVYEVDPEVIQQLGSLLADNALGVSALSASALVLLYRRLRKKA